MAKQGSFKRAVRRRTRETALHRGARRTGELDRLPGALNIRPLWLACLEYKMYVRAGHTPTLEEGWTHWRAEQAERLAAQAIASLQK